MNEEARRGSQQAVVLQDGELGRRRGSVRRWRDGVAASAAQNGIPRGVELYIRFIMGAADPDAWLDGLNETVGPHHALRATDISCACGRSCGADLANTR